jgi:hypothetical protein
MSKIAIQEQMNGTRWDGKDDIVFEHLIETPSSLKNKKLIC